MGLPGRIEGKLTIFADEVGVTAGDAVFNGADSADACADVCCDNVGAVR